MHKHNAPSPLPLTDTSVEATANTPLAPSVEKAYYRKCIELKRRLNEVEEANDAARLRRLRLNRAVLKMRLERAFLLEQMAKRMEVDDGVVGRDPVRLADGGRSGDGLAEEDGQDDMVEEGDEAA